MTKQNVQEENKGCITFKISFWTQLKWPFKMTKSKWNKVFSLKFIHLIFLSTCLHALLNLGKEKLLFPSGYTFTWQRNKGFPGLPG